MERLAGLFRDLHGSRCNMEDVLLYTHRGIPLHHHHNLSTSRPSIFLENKLESRAIQTIQKQTRTPQISTHAIRRF